MKLQTLKGFRDFLPEAAARRQWVIRIFQTMFERYGFDPLETPALEYAETLLGKYGGEADKLLYLFKDNGGRDVGLRYDQTVPLSRVVAQYQNELPIPFKRYQIQPVWRAENTQKGRYREFLQCDIDCIGSDSPMADAEIIICTLEILKKLGFQKPQIWLNDRKIFDQLGLTKKDIISVDKLDKIGPDAVVAELQKNGTGDAQSLLENLTQAKPTERLADIMTLLTRQGYKKGSDFMFVPTLARGLDYYTSTIFEAKIGDADSTLSVAGGGRYDDLIGQFSGKPMPAVGIAFGFDRLIDILLEQNLLNLPKTTTTVLVTQFFPDTAGNAQLLVNTLRLNGINTDIYPDPTAKLEKQLKYADKKGILYVVIQGPEELKTNVVQLKTMKTREAIKLTVEEAIKKIKSLQ